MGRYQTKIAPSQNPQNFQQQGLDQQFSPQDWPTEFPKCVIGIDRDGVINEWKNVIKKYEDLQLIEGSLEAIRQLRLKGHRVVLFSDQPNISSKKTKRFLLLFQKGIRSNKRQLIRREVKPQNLVIRIGQSCHFHSPLLTQSHPMAIAFT